MSNIKNMSNLDKVITDRKLGTTAKAVYAYFYNFSLSRNKPFISKTKICYDLDLSRVTFQKYLNQLEKHKVILIEPNLISNHFTKNVFTINWD